jgi:DNA-binding NarL/FixJ family response regulator
MGTILTYVKSKLAKSWINNISNDLSFIYNFRFYNSLDTLKNELDLKEINSNLVKIYVIIDVEDINYALYTKSYFSQNDNIKFIGVGYKKNVNEYIELIENNIFSFIIIGSDSIEIFNALKSVEKDISYFCKETNDHLLANYIKNIKHSNKIKSNNKLINTIDIPETIIDTLALTEKEKKVCSLLMQGLSYKEIATLIGVTVFAINQNTKSIYKKLKVRSRGELSFRMSS